MGVDSGQNKYEAAKLFFKSFACAIKTMGPIMCFILLYEYYTVYKVFTREPDLKYIEEEHIDKLVFKTGDVRALRNILTHNIARLTVSRVDSLEDVFEDIEKVFDDANIEYDANMFIEELKAALYKVSRHYSGERRNSSLTTTLGSFMKDISIEQSQSECKLKNLTERN